jgi:hypothetical protein
MATLYGQTVTSVTIPVSATIWIGPLWDGTRLCAVAYGAAYSITSTDNGVSWTSHTMAGTINRTGFCHDGTDFIAVQNGGTTSQYSSDGATWTAGGAMPSSTAWTALLNVGGRVTAFINGSASTAYTTNHGVTWTTGTSLTNAAGAYCAAASSTAAVCLALVTAKVAHRSTDGFATNAATTQLLYSNAVVYDTVHSRFVSTGYGANAGSSQYSDDDGLTWKAGGALPSAVTYNMSYYDGVCYAIPTATTAVIAKSTDGGTTWTTDATLPSTTTWRAYSAETYQAFVGTTTAAAYRRNIEHPLTSAAVSSSATSSGTFADSRPHALTSAAVSQSATSSGTFLRGFPGSHDIFISCISGHAAVNSDFLKITGRVFISAASAGSATSSATLSLTRAPTQFVAKFDSLVGTPKIQILRARDFYTYDSSDTTYKAAPTLANAQMTMTQIDATRWPTYYYKTVYTTDWTDGEYITHAVDASDTTNYRFDSYIYKNGSLYYGGLLSDERASVFQAAAASGGLTVAENAQLMGLPSAADNRIEMDTNSTKLDMAVSNVAAATLAAATTTPIAANIKKVKDQTISGIGTQSNPWGPV